MKQHHNALSGETSPYLLQHAGNPVNWYPWGEEALNKAKKEDKLLLISIGYSACHWCHVMERESFEDKEVAEIMNRHYVCIKVDREERPDIDQVYMSAVQLMTGRGGWPLNCIALPDQRPIYGGTYFPKEQWKEILLAVAGIYANEKDKAVEYAARLTQGINRKEPVNAGKPVSETSPDILHEAVQNWSRMFDNKEGGSGQAPKFPMPNNYLFLLRYGLQYKHRAVMEHVELTLDKMAMGGIYDQLGGGFSRYSTDGLWKVPHFEKMLYDNAQLLSLYAMAYKHFKKPLYKQAVEETFHFMENELKDPSGAYRSALDADSEGEEGKYYTWKKEEVEAVLGEHFPVFARYYNIGPVGHWEHGNHILLRKQPDEDAAKAENMSTTELHSTITACKHKLLKERSKRISPGIDDKCLSSWNALAIKGLADAYNAIGNESFKDAALRVGHFLLSRQVTPAGVFHSFKAGKTSISGFLEDVAFSAEAFLALYEISFDEQWLHAADMLAKHALQDYFDEKSGMFFFTSSRSPALITRNIEYNDNVTPSSNSSMARVLFLLSEYFDNNQYVELSKQMLEAVKSLIPQYAPAYSNWAMLLLDLCGPFGEVAICGDKALPIRNELSAYYFPNILLAGASATSNMPLCKNKFVEGKTFIYVCVNKNCQLPVENIADALKLLKTSGIC